MKKSDKLFALLMSLLLLLGMIPSYGFTAVAAPETKTMPYSTDYENLARLYPEPVTAITVSGDIAAEDMEIKAKGGTLQMSAEVFPSGASDKSVTWTVEDQKGRGGTTDKAEISPDGLLRAVKNGLVTVRATANDGSGATGTRLVNIKGQIENAPAQHGPAPSGPQLYYHMQEMSGFIHFGMNIFHDVHWGNGLEDPASFTLSTIDADQWVQTFQDAGFGRLLMVGKHHDGFCNWPTKYTPHSVAASPHQIDIMAAVSKAATDRNFDLGLYLSPWDANSEVEQGIYGDPAGQGKPYNDYYMNQLDELLDPTDKTYGNNGKFIEVWMDGAKDKSAAQPQKYWFTPWFTNQYSIDFPEYGDIRNERTWDGIIKGHNPDTVIFSSYGSEVRWVGNEQGYLSVPCWSKLNRSEMRDTYYNTGNDAMHVLVNGQADGQDWVVPEADTHLTNEWFDYWSNAMPLKDLGNIYFNSVGRGGVLLLNATPNRQGRLSNSQVMRLGEFGDAIRDTFKTNLAKGAAVTATSTRNNDSVFAPANVLDGDYDTYWTMNDGQTTGTITLDFGENKTFDVVSIQEYIPLGQRISKYKVQVNVGGNWKDFGNVNNCQTIGYKALVRDMPVTASGVRIEIEASQAVPLINSVGVYKAASDFALGEAEPEDGSLTKGKQADANAWFGDDSEAGSAEWLQWHPKNAIDGNPGTRWACRTAANGAWFTVDLERVEKINRFAFSGEYANRIQGFRIEYSDKTDDGWPSSTGAWTPAYTGTNSGSSCTGTFDEIEARYVRLYITSGVNEPSINTFGLFYDDGSLDKSDYHFSAAEYGTSNAEEKVTVTVKRTQSLDKASRVRIVTNTGTAVQNDFLNIPLEDQILEFAIGEQEKTVDIKILKNPMPATTLSRFFTVKLEAVGDDKLSLGTPNRALVTIYNADIDQEVNGEYLPAKLLSSGTVKTQCEQWTVESPNRAAGQKGAEGGNYLEVNSPVRFWYNAPAPGEYTVKMRYYTTRSLDTPNMVKWRGPNVESGSVVTPNRANAGEKYLTVVFPVTIKEAGKGYIEWYNDNAGTGASQGMPGLDWMVIAGQESGIDLSRHLIKEEGVTRVLATDYDLIANPANTEPCRDENGILNVGEMSAGTYLTYEITVEKSGDYDLVFRYAANRSPNGIYQILVDDQVAVNRVQFTDTGGWQTWQTSESYKITLTEGRHTLKINVTGEGSNLHWMEFTPAVPDTEVTWTGLTANGESNKITTTELTFTFDVEPEGLTANDITVTGAKKGALTGTGTTRKLAISDITVNNGEAVTVGLNSPGGFRITPDSKTVVVYKAQPADLSIDENYEIRLMTAPDKDQYNPKCSVKSINAASNITLYVVSYDAEGRLIEVNSFSSAIEKGQTVTLQASVSRAENATDYKFFIWDNALKPLTAINHI